MRELIFLLLFILPCLVLAGIINHEVNIQPYLSNQSVEGGENPFEFLWQIIECLLFAILVMVIWQFREYGKKLINLKAIKTIKVFITSPQGKIIFLWSFIGGLLFSIVPMLFESANPESSTFTLARWLNSLIYFSEFSSRIYFGRNIWIFFFGFFVTFILLISKKIYSETK